MEKWKDLPTTFRETQNQEMKTKRNKKWSYQVNVSFSTVFLAFLVKFDSLLKDARIHVADGFWQDQTFSQLWEDGSKVCFFLLTFKFLFEYLYMRFFLKELFL